MEQIQDDIEEVLPGLKDCAAYKNYVVRSGIIGRRHPQVLDEGTSLALVPLPPLSEKNLLLRSFHNPSSGPTSRSHQLSIEQLEAVHYILQAHQTVFCDGTRQGFLLGDGTGCGKTMILAAVISEYRLRGLKLAVYVTANQKLIDSAYEEVKAFDPSCAKLLVDFSTGVNSGNADGVLFLSYKVLSRESNQRLIQSYLGSTFSGLIILDEAHLVKTTGQKRGSISGKYLQILQEKCPDARVVYSTATGASETTHLLYMKRLGIFGPGSPFKDNVAFLKAIDKMGVAGMELLAMRLKQRGVFIARQLSYKGVVVNQIQAEMDRVYMDIYKRCCDMWVLLLVYAKKMKEAEKDKNKEDKIWGTRFAQLHVLALNFYESLITSSKMQSVAQRTLYDLRRDRAVVIGIQKTGESAFERFCSRTWNKGLPFSVAGDILRSALRTAEIKVGCPRIYSNSGWEELGTWSAEDDKAADTVINHKKESSDDSDDLGDDDQIESYDTDVSFAFPKALLRSSCPSLNTPVEPKKQKISLEYPKYSVGSYIDLSDVIPTWSVEGAAESLNSQTLARLYHELYLYLPINPLDELLNRLMHCPSMDGNVVSNCTGKQTAYIFNERKGRFDRIVTGGIDKEMNDFMNLEKRVAIISDAASVGVSFHADVTRKNKLKRTHITTQLPFSSVKFHQQSGRTHRTNQSCAPEYVIVSSPLAAEARFVSVVGQRLKQLGAICYGQSKACPISEHMVTYLCSSVAQSAIKKVIDDIASTDKIFRGLWQFIKPRDAQLNLEGQSGATKVAGNFFNRVLLLDPAMQEKILQAILDKMEVLRAQGQKVFSPMIEFSHTLHEDVTLESRVSYVVRNKATVDMLMFRLDRVLSYGNLRKDDPNALGFFMRANLPCFVIRRVDEPASADVYYPFARQPLKRSASEFENQRRLDVRESYELWSSSERRFRYTDGCMHTVMRTRFCAANCTLNYGVLFLYLLTGDVYDIMEDIWDVFADQKEAPQLGIVTYCSESQSTSSIGLLLHKDMAAKLSAKLEVLR